MTDDVLLFADETMRSNKNREQVERELGEEKNDFKTLDLKQVFFKDTYLSKSQSQQINILINWF